MDDAENSVDAVSDSTVQREPTVVSTADNEPNGGEVQLAVKTPCSEIRAATNEVGSCLLDASLHSSDDAWSSFSDEESEAEERDPNLRPLLRIDDIRVVDDAVAYDGEKLEPQQPISKFETIYEMTRKFVHHFSAPHVQRECDNGVYICCVCQSAQRTLAEIRFAIDKNPEGRHIVLNNSNFMKLLVKLCSLDPLKQPRICSSSSSQLEEFYETRAACRTLTGGISVLDDQASKKLWKDFLGDATKDVETLTYNFKLLGASPTGGCGDAKSAANAGFETGSLDVARCIDARHFIVYRSTKMSEDVRAMAEYNRKVMDRDPRQDPPDVGAVGGVIVPGGELVRVLVLKVIKRVAVLWEIDHGRIRCVNWAKLVDILPAFRSMPPAIGLAVVLDEQAVPFLKLLRECVEILRSIVDTEEQEYAVHTAMVNKLTEFGVIDVLRDLILCLDYETRMAALACLILLCHRQYGRQAVANAGFVDRVVARVDELAGKHQGWRRRVPEEKEKEALLDLLRSMFFRNDMIRRDSAYSDVVGVLSKVRENTGPGNDLFHGDVERCLRSILGPLPRRGPASPNRQYGNHGASSVYAHRGRPAYGWDYVQQRSASRHPFNQATQAALTSDRLVSHKHSSKTLECYDGVEPLSPAHFRPELTMSSNASVSSVAGPPSRGGGRFYVRGMVVPLRSDETHELRTVQSMRQVSARTLANVACSFLNSWKPCTIYYGISADGFVRGMILSKEEKDNVRTGVDSMMGNLRPQLSSSSFGVKFLPVLRSAADPPENAVHFVVEVWVRGVPDTVYTSWEGDCYLREKATSYQAFTNDVRMWVAKKEEARYRNAEKGSEHKDPIEVAAIPAAAPSAETSGERQ